jgi:hypothetical protein
MKKVVKWLVLGIFVLSSVGFGIAQTNPGADGGIKGGCGKVAVSRYHPGC